MGRGVSSDAQPRGEAPAYHDLVSSSGPESPRAARGPSAPADGVSAEDVPHIPLLEDELDHAEKRPTWRGWIHAGMFPLAIVAGVILISLADGAVAKTASAIFTVTSLLLFGNSALYHRFDWKPKAKMLLKRIDHANIFLLIAGTYTPLALLALPPSKGVLLLSLVWIVALLGILFRVLWIGAPRWSYVALYLGLGFVAVMYVGDLFAADPAMMALVFIGGLFYTVGALIYGFKRPNPFPGRFGFHEIFHACTAVAFGCHWTATLLIAISPAYNG